MSAPATNALRTDWILFVLLSPLILCGLVGWCVGSAIGYLLRDRS